MTNLEQITEIVIWWRELPHDYNGLEDLMQQRQLLTSYIFDYANELAKHRKDWAKSQYLLEKGKNQKRVQFIDKGTTKADYMARANTAQEFESERTDEAIYWGMRDIYESALEVSQAMAQRIAHLREEWKLKNLQPT